MPQWYRDRASDSAKYPDERWQASCPADAVPLLRRYDHHTVWVNGRQALLRTYHGVGEESARQLDPRRLEISFTYAAGHPSAPLAVQAVVDGLTFTRIPIATERANER
jgi:hypothetical protein